MEISPSCESIDLETIRSRLSKLEEYGSNFEEEIPASDSEQLLRDCTLQLQSKVNEIISDCSHFDFLGIQDLDAYVEHLKKELSTAEAESAKISKEIEDLNGKHVEDILQFENHLEGLQCSLDNISSQVLEKEQEERTNWEHEFEITKLENQIDNSQMILTSLQDLDKIFKRFETIEQVEDELSGIKVIEFDGSSIRLSLRTYVPIFDLSQEKIDYTAEPSEVNHELLIEVAGELMQLKNVEIFPNDVYISDILNAAKSFRQLFSLLATAETRSPLEWFVGKVQDRIAQSFLRQLLVRRLNESRYLLTYLAKDETVRASLSGGVDAIIKFSQGWPISSFPLKLISLKSSDHHSKEISSLFLCRIEEMVNSLDIHMRQNLSSFVDAIEKALVEQLRLEHSAHQSITSVVAST